MSACKTRKRARCRWNSPFPTLSFGRFPFLKIPECDRSRAPTPFHLVLSRFSLHLIERAIRAFQKLLNGGAALRECRDADAEAKAWRLHIRVQAIPYARDNLSRGGFAGLRQHEREFVAAVARGGVNRTALQPQGIGHAAKRAATGNVS